MYHTLTTTNIRVNQIKPHHFSVPSGGSLSVINLCIQNQISTGGHRKLPLVASFPHCPPTPGPHRSAQLHRKFPMVIVLSVGHRIVLRSGCDRIYAKPPVDIPHAERPPPQPPIPVDPSHSTGCILP